MAHFVGITGTGLFLIALWSALWFVFLIWKDNHSKTLYSIYEAAKEIDGDLKKELAAANTSYWDCEHAECDVFLDGEGDEFYIYNCTHPAGSGLCDLQNKSGCQKESCILLENDAHFKEVERLIELENEFSLLKISRAGLEP